MSLEQALAANTAAVNALVVALTSGNIGAAAPVTVAAETPAPKAEKAATTKKTEKAASTPAAEPEAEAIPYETVKTATLEFIKVKGRDAFTALAAQFGVGSAKDLKPEQYAEYLEKLEAEKQEDDVA